MRRFLKYYDRIWKNAGILVAVTIPLFLFAPLSAQPQAWIEDSFEDFADGTLDASGQNIYVSKSGSIRTIHRFDLNDDGFIDLMFNSTHDEYNFIPATLAHISDRRSMDIERIAVEGSMSAAVEDLNGDSFPDIVFCPNPSGVQRSRRFVTIAWGNEDGWPAHRVNGILPVHGARKMAIADLNADNWPDIVVLCGSRWLPGQPEGTIVKVFWGGERGYLLQRYKDIGVPSTTDIASGDFDGDGSRDIAVLSSGGGIGFLWSSKNDDTVHTESQVKIPDGGVQCITCADIDDDGNTDLIVGTEREAIHIIPGKDRRSWEKPVTVRGFNASHIVPDDIDGDGRTDIVLSYFVQVRAGGGELSGGKDDAGSYVTVLWGGKSGFHRDSNTRLEAPYNIASAIADFDGDGQKDIVCAVHQGDKKYAAEAPVYFGVGERKFVRAGTGIPSEGAYGVTVVPGMNGNEPSAVICNGRGGSLREEVPLLLYWGGRNGFDRNRGVKIPFRSGYEATAADLNEDGYTDLIAIDEMHGGQGANEDPWHGANIFWGGPSYFDPPDRHTVLNEINAGTSNTADLNRDGYLDIVVGFFNRSDGKPTELVIYYGSQNGYGKENRTAIPCVGRSNSPVIADFDRDGWLDIAVGSFLENRLRIFYGGEDGFSESRRTETDIPGLIDQDAADLNGDGWLDIIACSYYDNVNNHNDTGVLLLWGSADGYSHANAQWLPGMTPLGPVIADFDGDSLLDLFCPHYHGELTREKLPSYLYWNSPDGFHTRRRTTLVNDSAADGLAADFDRDGLLDLCVVNHTVDGNHSLALSKIIYNDNKRFTDPERIEYLPSPGSHWMWNEDMGHIYTRKWEQTYVSSSFRLDRSSTSGSLDFKAAIPPETKLLFQIKSAQSENKLTKAQWRTVNDNTFLLNEDDRFVRYKAIFVSDNGDRYPVLDRIEIVFD